MRTVGRIYKSILRAKPGRKPCKKDLMNFLPKAEKNTSLTIR
jgi:hypothetical protein